VCDDGAAGRAGFTRRTVVLEPGASRRSHDAEWHDAIVMVESGDVELECAAGGRRRFTAGAVLWLAGIDLRVLHNVGPGPVVLVAVSRRRDPGPHAPPGRVVEGHPRPGGEFGPPTPV
jgi:quercetin dioxygenase-like cupin family protein